MPVGVTSPNVLTDKALQSLKQQAFFFENIKVVWETGAWVEILPKSHKTEEINYLLDCGFLQHSFEINNLAKNHGNLDITVKDLIMLIEVLVKHFDWRQSLDNELNFDTVTNYCASRSYLETFLLRRFSKLDAICIDSFWKGDGVDVDRNVSKRDLYEITISGLSLPADSVPWEDVFTFRSEVASQQQLRALRLWIADMAKGKLSYAEAIDKVEYLKEQYRTHMKGAGIRARNGILRALVVGAADIIESTIKLKLKAFAEAPFKLLDAKADLMEADRKAVGRELAYVVRVEETFQR